MLGARQSLLSLARGLRRGGRFAPIVGVPRPGALTEHLEEAGVPWIVLPTSPWRKVKSWRAIPGEVAAIRRVIKDHKIRLVHCNEIYPLPHALTAAAPDPLLLALARRTFLRRIWPENQTSIPVLAHTRLGLRPRLVRNYHVEDARRIIAVSDAMAQDLRPFPKATQRTTVVHNGIDLTPFEAAHREREKARANLGFLPEHVVFGHIGLLGPRKRPEYLLKAAPAILREVPHARFLIVGDPSPTDPGYRDRLHKLAYDLGIEPHTVFVPFQKDVTRFFSALDIHILLSNEEGFGRVILEAAGAKVPTIATRIGGIPELIQAAETGYLIGGPEVATQAGMDDALGGFVRMAIELARDPARRHRMGEAANRLAHERFSEASYVHGVEGVFLEVLGLR
jgi:glycosyltransferase involved in cell wall biosynthesis